MNDYNSLTSHIPPHLSCSSPLFLSRLCNTPRCSLIVSQTYTLIIAAPSSPLISPSSLFHTLVVLLVSVVKPYFVLYLFQTPSPHLTISFISFIPLMASVVRVQVLYNVVPPFFQHFTTSLSSLRLSHSYLCSTINIGCGAHPLTISAPPSFSTSFNAIISFHLFIHPPSLFHLFSSLFHTFVALLASVVRVKGVFNTFTTAPLMICRAVSVMVALAFLAEEEGLTEEVGSEEAIVVEQKRVMVVMRGR